MFKSTQNFFILIATITLLFSACSIQSSQQSAKQVELDREYLANLEQLRIECENNNAVSCFEYGAKVDSDKKETTDLMQKYLLKSCNLNYGDGCFFYAMLSAVSVLDSTNSKVDKSSRELMGNDKFNIFLKYIKKSCELDSANGCEALGVLYYSGDGVKKDEKLGFFYRKKGCDLAQTYKDKDLADMAGVNGCARVGLMYYNGESVAQNKKLALEYFYKGCAFSNYRCGDYAQDFYKGYNGESIKVPQDYEFAFKLAKKGCELNDSKSCNYLGILYQEGKGTNQDLQKAFRAFQKLCYEGTIGIIGYQQTGCYNLALCYANGQGVEQNYKRAFGIFKELCDKDKMASACGIVGECYYNAKGVRQDYREALEYFSLACDMGEQSGCDNHKMMKQNPYMHGLRNSDFE